ncbi:MAG: hypothetical protein WCF65_07540 [Parachlamydiaceae bacterium]
MSSLTLTGFSSDPSALVARVSQLEAPLRIVLKQTQRTSIYEQLFYELETMDSKFTSWSDVRSQLIHSWMQPVILAMRGIPLTSETITDDFLKEIYFNLLKLDLILREKFDCLDVEPLDIYSNSYKNAVEDHEYAHETFGWMVKILLEILLSEKIISCDQLTVCLQESMDRNRLAMAALQTRSETFRRVVGELTSQMELATRQAKDAQVTAAATNQLARELAEKNAAAFTLLQAQLHARNDAMIQQVRAHAQQAESQLNVLEGSVWQLNVSNAANASIAAAAQRDMAVERERGKELAKEVEALRHRPPVVVTKTRCVIS